MGFESKLFVDLSKREAKHLICSICLQIYENAINTECGHTFCNQCLKKWIEDNHKVCPECRKEFSRKRSNGVAMNDISTIIANYVFSRNLKINAIINELIIKCEFEFNGCKESVELGLMSSHLKECKRRFCDDCGFTAGKPDSHNCIQLLKSSLHECKNKLKQMNEQKVKLEEELKTSKITANGWKNMYEKSEEINKNLTEITTKLKEMYKSKENDWKLKFEKMIETESKRNQELDSRKLYLNEITAQFEDLELVTEYVLFGTHSIPFCKVVLRPNRLYFKPSINPRFFLPINYIEELMVCLDSDLPVIIIKPNIISGSAIKNHICGYISDHMNACYDVQSRGFVK